MALKIPYVYDYTECVNESGDLDAVFSPELLKWGGCHYCLPADYFKVF
jgi:hypothetical protein